MLPLLREKLKALNPTVLTDDARVDAIITKLRGCRDNQQWLAWLKDGVNYKFDAAENAQDVRLIDLRQSGRQRLVGDQPVSDRRAIAASPRHRAAHQRHSHRRHRGQDGQPSKPDWREGAKQLGMYAEEIDQLFYTNAYGVGVNETG